MSGHGTSRIPQAVFPNALPSARVLPEATACHAKGDSARPEGTFPTRVVPGSVPRRRRAMDKAWTRTKRVAHEFQELRGILDFQISSRGGAGLEALGNWLVSREHANTRRTMALSGCLLR